MAPSRTISEVEASPDLRGGTRADALDRELEAAQAALLDREVGRWSTRRLRWSGGETQLIEAGEGEPILLVHGGMGNAADWAPLLGRLARSRRVLAVDRPGHGLASAFDYRGVDLAEHAAGFLREVLDAAGIERVDVAANSMGGLFALSLAERHPERLRMLVLVGAPAGSERRIPGKVAGLAVPVLGSLIVRFMIRRSTVASTRSFWDGLIAVHADRLPDDLLNVAAIAARRNADSWLGVVRAAATPRRIRTRYLVDRRLPGVAVPLAWVWGDQDAFASAADGRRLASLAPQPGPFTVIPGAGHLPWLDEPDLVADAILRALSGTDAPRRPAA